MNAAAPLMFSMEKVHLNPISSWDPLAASFGAKSVSAIFVIVVFMIQHHHNYLVKYFHLTTDIESRRRLMRSVDASTLVFHSTSRSTQGDSAFRVTAACAWNSVPPSFKKTDSLPSFSNSWRHFCFNRHSSWLNTVTWLSRLTLFLERVTYLLHKYLQPIHARASVFQP